MLFTEKTTHFFVVEKQIALQMGFNLSSSKVIPLKGLNLCILVIAKKKLTGLINLGHIFSYVHACKNDIINLGRVLVHLREWFGKNYKF